MRFFSLMRRLLLLVARPPDAYGDCTRTSTSPLAAMNRKKAMELAQVSIRSGASLWSGNVQVAGCGCGVAGRLAHLRRTEERGRGRRGANDLCKAAGGVCAGRDAQWKLRSCEEVAVRRRKVRRR